jgi:hypothetical protein
MSRAGKVWAAVGVAALGLVAFAGGVGAGVGFMTTWMSVNALTAATAYAGLMHAAVIKLDDGRPGDAKQWLTTCVDSEIVAIDGWQRTLRRQDDRARTLLLRIARHRQTHPPVRQESPDLAVMHAEADAILARALAEAEASPSPSADRPE